MKNLDQIKELAESLLEKMGFPTELTVSADTEAEAVRVEIKMEDFSNLIGFHGRTLSSFQLILGLMAFKKFGEWTRIIVDVNNYRQEQAERLESVAMDIAGKVKASGRPEALSPMTPYERRLIHLALSKEEKVETFSSGKGSFRHVVIAPKGFSDQNKEVVNVDGGVEKVAPIADLEKEIEELPELPNVEPPKRREKVE